MSIEIGEVDSRLPHERSLALLCLSALGIVYGDIGTSPLYAFKVAVQAAAAGSGAPTEPQVLGILSLIIWALIVIVSFKYVVFVMRADNHGEGGILALLALVRPWSGAPPARRGFLIMLGLFGAALLYGDGVITPAISVMSAVEGLEVIAPDLSHYVKPLTVIILIGLFLVQVKGTAKIGRFFGPVMAVWFVVIAVLGAASVVLTPRVLVALDPVYAFNLLSGGGGGTAVLVFGAVFLAMTGGEALYADMGHVGRYPIRVSWALFVLPALVLNYAGQAALVLRDPTEIQNPFYHLAPSLLMLPLVVLATAATVIASQALISGVFSMTRQACQLGLWPRLKIVQTSVEGYGQIYVPVANWGLMVLTVAVALGFRTSDDLAAAYGIAVSGTMLITTVLLSEAMRVCWGWPKLVRLPLTMLFLMVESAFCVANMAKLVEGGWLPLAGGVAVFALMAIWTKGAGLVDRRLLSLTESLPDFMAVLDSGTVARVPGTGVFVTRSKADLPPALLHHVKHNRVLYDRLIILSISTAEVPRIPARERFDIQQLGPGFWRVRAHYGFMQVPNVPVALRRCGLPNIQQEIEADNLTYYVGHERIVPNEDNPAMVGLEESLFAFMARNAAHPVDYFKIPDQQVMEVGIRIEI
ncbi:MAG: KUP/HAK/KT family potassium transporter [Rhodospirillaceae bacterium]